MVGHVEWWVRVRCLRPFCRFLPSWFSWNFRLRRGLRNVLQNDMTYCIFMTYYIHWHAINYYRYVDVCFDVFADFIEHAILWHLYFSINTGSTIGYHYLNVHTGDDIFPFHYSSQVRFGRGPRNISFGFCFMTDSPWDKFLPIELALNEKVKSNRLILCFRVST